MNEVQANRRRVRNALFLFAVAVFGGLVLALRRQVKPEMVDMGLAVLMMVCSTGWLIKAGLQRRSGSLLAAGLGLAGIAMVELSVPAHPHFLLIGTISLGVALFTERFLNNWKTAVR